MNSPIEVISLCSGGGISEFGSKKIFRTRLAVELNARAALTFAANHIGTRVVQADMESESLIQWAKNEYPEVRGVIAAPPCQAHSLAGSGSLCDPRNWLYHAPLKWIKAFQPDFYICENVKAIRGSPHLKLKEMRLMQLGYNVTEVLINAAWYGVAQNRWRLFLIAVKKGLPIPLLPEPAHGEGKLPFVSLGNAIGNLSENDALKLGCAKLSADRQRTMSMVGPGECWMSLPLDVKEIVLKNASDQSGNLCRRYAYYELSKALTTGPSTLRKTKPLHPGYKIENNGKMRRCMFGKPVPTLTTNPTRTSSGLLHPGHEFGAEPFKRGDYWYQPNGELLITRCLSVVEYLILQGIDPDKFRFGFAKGINPDALVAEKYKIVGNGIPAPMMEAVCRSVRDALYQFDISRTGNLALGA